MKKTLLDIDVYGKKVLLRVDFNVPIKDGKITDDTRIVESLDTIKYLLDKGASIIIMSHLGRPDGEVVKKYSLKPVYERLQELLPNTKIHMAKDVVGDDAHKKASKLKMGEILLLENTRFEKGEEANDPEFCKSLASLGDVYVNDAFGTAHRKHASTYGVGKLMPSAIGFLIERELNAINGALENKKRPFVALLGGAKVSDKLGIVDKMCDIADTIIIGGGMAYTFLKAMGYKMGKSIVDTEKIELARNILFKANEKDVKILLPCDHIVGKSIEDKEGVYIRTINIPDGYMGLDIGKLTIKQYTKAIKKARTVIWNGPMGVFENPAFSEGTYKVAKAVAKCKGTTIVGGGDSVSAIDKMGFEKKITHISTGGGASLKLFEGKILPGVDVIENK